MNGAELFVKCLEGVGVKYIFGVPGEENLSLLEAIRKSSINFVTTHNEQSAVFMAATVGRLTGKTGVALSTLGPGATNLVTGIAYGQLGGMPLLVITGQKPIKKNKQGNFQIVDVVRMMEPITKFSKTIVSADRIPSLVYQAIKTAETERPGAVHLELPEDIADEISEVKPIIRNKIRRPAPDDKAIDYAVDMIKSANSPVIIVGSGANRKLIRKQLKNILDKTGIPFISTQMGKGVEDESSFNYLGTAAVSRGDMIHKILDESDLLIMIGHDIYEKPPFFPRNNQKIIDINFSTANVEDIYIPDFELVGDVANSLWLISEKLQKQPHWDYKKIFELKKDVEKYTNSGSGLPDFPIRPQRFVSDLRKIVPKDGIISLDNGMYKLWIARNYPAYDQNTVLLDNAFATMGAGLSAGITAKILNPDKKVVVVAGDGGIQMNIAEIETAVRLGIDLVIIVLVDNEYGMINWKQHEMGFKKFGLEFKSPNFEMLAKSFGADGYKVTNTNDFTKILNEVLSKNGVNILEVPISYDEKFI